MLTKNVLRNRSIYKGSWKGKVTTEVECIEQHGVLRNKISKPFIKTINTYSEKQNY